MRLIVPLNHSVNQTAPSVPPVIPSKMQPEGNGVQLGTWKDDTAPGTVTTLEE
jgi:hypothetical protein